MQVGARNQAPGLRALDWRFLLPRPPSGQFQHLALLGGCGKVAESILDLGLARRVSRDLPLTRSADAVVMLRAAQTSLAEAAGRLRPGGVLYGEIERGHRWSLPTTPGALRRALRQAGMAHATVYWVAPTFENHEIYLPVHARSVVRWYWATMASPDTVNRRVAYATARFLARLGTTPHLRFVRRYAVTAVAGPAKGATPAILSSVALPMAACLADLALLTPGRTDRGGVVALPFARGRSTPVVAVKTRRSGRESVRIEREQQALADAAGRLDAPLRRTIPSSIALVWDGSLAVGVEAYANGRSLAARCAQRGASTARKVADLRLAVRWLIDFHRQTLVQRAPWTAGDMDRWIMTPLAAYKRTFGVTAAEARLFEGVCERASRLLGMSLPIVRQHNDFDPWNVNVAGDHLMVFDWECSTIGPALTDLLYFLIIWSCVARNLHSEEAQRLDFQRLFVPAHATDALSMAARQAIAEYARALDIAPGFTPVLLVTTLAFHAVDRLERLGTRPGAGADVRGGSRYVKYLEVLSRAPQTWLLGQTAESG